MFDIQPSFHMLELASPLSSVRYYVGHCTLNSEHKHINHEKIKVLEKLMHSLQNKHLSVT